MEKLNLSEKVLDIIKDRKIHQKARWTFLLRNWAVWISGIVSLVVGALAFSVMIYMIKHGGWSDYYFANESFLQFLMFNLPYFWIGFLILFILVAYFNIRHTKSGYKYPLPVLALVSILASLVVGTFFYNIGMGQAIDDILSKSAPFYSELMNPSLHTWNQPDKGLLSGKIILVDGEQEFSLLDVDDKEWIVFCDNCFVSPMVELSKNSQINIIGKKINTNTFVAEFIKPMGAGRGFFERGMGGKRRNHQNNINLFGENLEAIPQIIENHPEMKEMLKNHIERNKQEIDLFLEGRPELREKIEGI